MGRACFYNRRKYSIMILVVLLLSFLGVRAEMVYDCDDYAPFKQCCFDSPASSLNEIICSEESLQSTTQSVLQRQVRLQKKSVGCIVKYIFSGIDMPTFLELSISILGLYYFISNCSHRFVIKFIHNKDEQKA